jgi:hypothetical protein
MFELLTQPHIRKRIQSAMYHIVPRTWWSGDHRRVETLEMLEEVAERDGDDGHRPDRLLPVEQSHFHSEDPA